MAPPKVTLYVRDDQLWQRAREAAGPGGLSGLVQQSLRDYFDRAGAASVSPPSVLERARRLRQDADTLVRVLEQDPSNSPKRNRARLPRGR